MAAEVYRQAASVLVLRPSQGGSSSPYDVLLLHKPRKNDAWQLPQGGMEAGESVREAALRELREEASIEGCEVLGESACVYQYDFPSSYRRFRPDNVIGQRIGFIMALAPAGAAVRVDNKEIDDHRWVDIEAMAGLVRRPEYVQIVRKVYDEAVEALRQTR